MPPPPLGACFGRDEPIEKIIDLAKNLTSTALIGPGGIGKTSIALTVLHHDRIKQRFGDNRRFIRCDEFPASHTHLLSRLSKVIGAGIENPDGLAPLRPFLSSMEMILVLDNAESILDPQGTDAREIYAVVEELSRFGNVCLCITSRISTVPPACESFDIPTLSMEAARNAFHRIYKNSRRSDLIDGILEQLDFHPLSITLLATVAHHNRWTTDRLSREWEKQRTGMLHTKHDISLATTVELSLASPMFQELGPDARELLGVVAFFPQGINEDNLDWLFPALPNKPNIFDDFCILSLTYRINGFIMMLAPLRDYLCPKNPASSPLLCATKDHYFRRLSVQVEPGKPGFEEARWMISEDVNIERLLDVFASVDSNSVGVWDACSDFMTHLYWHKPRLVTLGPKIEGLPDDHPSKLRCLYQLSWLFGSVGNNVECRRRLVQHLKLQKDRGDDLKVAETLRFLSKTNWLLGLHKEGIEQAKEALKICEQLNDIMGQAHSWRWLAWPLLYDEQLDAAEEAASKAIGLVPDEVDRFLVCDCYRALGDICHWRGETDKAISHFEAALAIASSFGWHDHLFWNHFSLADLFSSVRRFDDAHAHVEHAKTYAGNDPYQLGRAMHLQAQFWYEQCMLKEAKSEALRATSVYEKIGATEEVKHCNALLQDIEKASRKTDPNGERLKTVLLLTHTNSLLSA